MTLYHAINIISLAILPIYFTYKFSVNLSEYGGIARCLQVGGFYYIYTQILKMLLLTFFPSSETAFVSGFLPELISSMIDCLGLLYALRKLSGKGHMKLLQIAIGWCSAETIFTRGLSLWRAKGVEFEWTYTQKALESNMCFVETLILITLIWVLDRNDLNKKYIIQIYLLLAAIIIGRPLIIAEPWSKLLIHLGMSVTVGIPTLFIYSSMQNSNY